MTAGGDVPGVRSAGRDAPGVRPMPGGGDLLPPSPDAEDADAAAPPSLVTPRLRLRAFRPEDAPSVRALAGAREVAAFTERIPHPYEEGHAEAWIAGLPELFRAGREVVFAITRIEDGTLVGAMGLRLEPEHARAELGYWVGVPYWGRGYATEAARAVLSYGFGALGLNRIEADHLARNPASGRVLEKIGMREEGVLRRRVRKWGEFLDVRRLAILREEHPGEDARPVRGDDGPRKRHDADRGEGGAGPGKEGG